MRQNGLRAIQPRSFVPRTTDSRKIVGWAMAKTMHKELVVKALEKAAGNQRLSSGLIVHSDQGSQYNSGSFKELLRKHGFRQSMARKDEVLDKGSFDDYEQAFSRTSEFIEVYYNRTRLHSAIQYRTPGECESFFFSSVDCCPEK